MLELWLDLPEYRWLFDRCYSMVLNPGPIMPMPYLLLELKSIPCHPYYQMVAAKTFYNLPCDYELKSNKQTMNSLIKSLKTRCFISSVKNYITKMHSRFNTFFIFRHLFTFFFIQTLCNFA